MGSLTIDGVWFAAYSDDHLPPHVHGFYGDTETIVELISPMSVGLSKRIDAIRPANAKRSDVRRILRVAATHFDVLMKLWEDTHGKR